MKRLIYILPLLLLFIVEIQSQNNPREIKGIVTFTTAKDTYVRFGNTEDIQLGDTLYNNGFPCLLIKQKSSSSCICESINDCKIEKDQEIIYSPRRKKVIEEDIIKPSQEANNNIPKLNEASIIAKETTRNRESIRARISASTNSNLSSEENDDIHRTMLRFNLNAYHINNSNLSLETYINFRENFLEREVADDYQTRYFNAYNLALIYHLDSSSTISLGRKINRKISSVGPIDGLQIEKNMGSFHAGGIIGFKPDLRAFGFNHDLLEYGAYFGFGHNSSNVFSESTIGFLEQRNAGPIDRRYAYLQHSSTFNRKLSIFSSIELDLYEKVNGTTAINPRLTNLFISTRYRFGRKLSLSLSYDARKRIIYYETLRTEVERLLDDDEARQGIRIRLNGQPLKYIHAGISYGKRFQNDGQNKSNNINLYISHSKLPFIKGRVSLNFNKNNSNYSNNRIYAIRHSRTLIKRILEGNFYYRLVQYNYINSEQMTRQKYYGVNFAFRISKTIRFSLLGELASRDNGQSNLRFNTKLVKRFTKKNKQ